MAETIITTPPAEIVEAQVTFHIIDNEVKLTIIRTSERLHAKQALAIGKLFDPKDEA